MTNPAAAGQPDQDQETPAPKGRKGELCTYQFFCRQAEARRRQWAPPGSGERRHSTPNLFLGRVREEIQTLLRERRLSMITGNCLISESPIRPETAPIMVQAVNKYVPPRRLDFGWC